MRDQEAQQRRQQMSHQQAFHPTAREPQPVSIVGGSAGLPPAVELDENSRRIVEKRYGQEQFRSRREDLQRPPEQTHRQSQINVASAKQAIFGGSSSTSHRQNTPSQSPATSSLPIPVGLGNPPRPSSVPVVISAPVPPPQPKKKSNIMDMLNPEPAEPKQAKRYSDPRAGASTPDPRIAEPLIQQPPRAVSQQFVRPETPTGGIQTVSMAQQQQRQDPNPRVGLMREFNPSTHRASMDERILHQARSSVSQHPIEAPFLSSASRPSLISVPRERGPMSPPVPHSRTSSYSSSIHQPTQHPEPRPTISHPPTGSRLRDNPYANTPAPQHPPIPPYPPVQQHSHAFNPTQPRPAHQIADEPRRSLDADSSHPLYQRQPPRQIFDDALPPPPPQPPHHPRHSHSHIHADDHRRIIEHQDPQQYAQHLQRIQQDAEAQAQVEARDRGRLQVAQQQQQQQQRDSLLRRQEQEDSLRREHHALRERERERERELERARESREGRFAGFYNQDGRR